VITDRHKLQESANEVHIKHHKETCSSSTQTSLHRPQQQMSLLRAFPDQKTVNAHQPPANKSQETKYAATHLGMRFETSPLFKFPLDLRYLCCLHALLRLVAITFQRTIKMNLDTQPKAYAINGALKALDLKCKKVSMRKKDASKKKDTELTNFIGR
jgi:hypothetical protein